MDTKITYASIVKSQTPYLEINNKIYKLEQNIVELQKELLDTRELYNSRFQSINNVLDGIINKMYDISKIVEHLDTMSKKFNCKLSIIEQNIKFMTYEEPTFLDDWMTIDNPLSNEHKYIGLGRKRFYSIVLDLEKKFNKLDTN